jgi:Predicted permeases
MGLILVFGISTLASRFGEDEKIKEELIDKLNEPEEKGNLIIRWFKALLQLTIDTVPAYLIVVTLLGAARSWLFPVIGQGQANSFLIIMFLAITGTLFTIPTAAEVPIVQTLMSFGLGVGPAGALLMTLPAISLPSLFLVRRVFSKKILVFLPMAVVVIGFASGLLAMIVL